MSAKHIPKFTSDIFFLARIRSHSRLWYNTASGGDVSKFTTCHSIISKMSSKFKLWVHLRFSLLSKVYVLNVFTQSLIFWICDCWYYNYYYYYANKTFLSIHVLEKIDLDKSIHMAIRLHSFSKRLACTCLPKLWHVSVSSTLLRRRVSCNKNAAPGICQNKIFRGCMPPDPLARLRAYGARRSDL